MKFDEYRPLALRTAKMFPTSREDLRHAALGLITEIGEFATEVKRHVIYGKPLTDEMIAHMREELGDACWYVPLGMEAFGVSALPSLSTKETREMEVAIVHLTDAAFLLNLFSSTITGYAVKPNSADRYEVLIYLATIVFLINVIAVKFLGTTGDQLRADNIAKLRLRFPDKYSDDAAEARADKNGLPATLS